MVNLCCLSQVHYADLDYLLDDNQAVFTALPKDWFDDVSSHAHKIAIIDNGRAVGFFVMDFGKDKFTYTNNPNACLLRSMSINPIYQGRGIAKQALKTALLKAYCQSHIFGCDEIVLGVNHANIAAQRLYEKTGFIRQPKIVVGKKGDQFVYALSL